MRCNTCGASGHTSNYCSKNRQPNTTTVEKRITTSTSTNPKPSGVIRTVTSIHDESEEDEPGNDDIDIVEAALEEVDLQEEVYEEDMMDEYQVRVISNPSELNASYTVVGYASGKPIHCTLEVVQPARVFDSLPDRARKDFTATTSRLATADGTGLVVIGSANITLRMKSNDGIKEMVVKFHIVKKLTAPCLLGTDFTNKYGAGMMWTKNRRHLILKDGSHVPFWDGAEQSTETGQKAKKKSEHRVMLIRLEQNLLLKASSATCFPGAYCFTISDDPVLHDARF